ncbi:endolytic transglycosylase MltG [Gracilibacillus boraciitolerans]|uniref:endolytic transglycosylase MltG n=1 Tax=Gracilibacillus boraciitolerans TaxID=307521 RepID=UPI0004B2FED8|nr:endolytic transglycosylase MltG [Gracilibacillus boraciitolerans]
MKQFIRAFSSGLLVAAVILGGVFLLENPSASSDNLSTDEKIDQLQKDGYFVYQQNMEEKLSNIEQEVMELKKHSLDSKEENGQSTLEETPVIATITIESGMSITDIVDLLVDQSIISDRDAFISYLKENELSRSIQIGQFTLHDQMNNEEIANMLTKQ